MCASCDCCWVGPEESDSEARESCPECSSTARKISVQITEKIKFYDSIGGKIKDPSLPSRKKVRVEFFDGFEWSVAYEKYVKKSVVRDKRKNHYHEKVEDPDTGEIIHECTEPLTEHRDHGSAKFKGDKKNRNDMRKSFAKATIE